MPMTVDISGADRKLAKALRALSRPEMKKTLTRAGLYLLRIQRTRVETRGLGSDNKPMVSVADDGTGGGAYQPDYAEFRRRHGRTVDRRTLVFTGQMLGSRRIIKATADRIRFGWKPGKQAVKALANERRTPFIAPTKQERKKVIAFLRKQVKRKVKS